MSKIHKEFQQGSPLSRGRHLIKDKQLLKSMMEKEKSKSPKSPRKKQSRTTTMGMKSKSTVLSTPLINQIIYSYASVG